MTNESAILGRIADDYKTIAALTAERDALKAEVEQLRQALTKATRTAPVNAGFEIDRTPGHPGVPV